MKRLRIENGFIAVPQRFVAVGDFSVLDAPATGARLVSPELMAGARDRGARLRSNADRDTRGGVMCYGS